MMKPKVDGRPIDGFQKKLYLKIRKKFCARTDDKKMG
jgi:hypothetical protein